MSALLLLAVLTLEALGCTRERPVGRRLQGFLNLVLSTFDVTLKHWSLGVLMPPDVARHPFELLNSPLCILAK